MYKDTQGRRQMDIRVKINNSQECYDLVDVDSDQAHDGDNAKELIAQVFEKKNALKIAYLLNTYKNEGKIIRGPH